MDTGGDRRKLVRWGSSGKGEGTRQTLDVVKSINRVYDPRESDQNSGRENRKKNSRGKRLHNSRGS